MGITLSTTAFTSINLVKNDSSAQSQLQKNNSNDNDSNSKVLKNTKVCNYNGSAMYLTSGGVPGGDIFCDSQKRDDKVCKLSSLDRLSQ